MQYAKREVCYQCDGNEYVNYGLDTREVPLIRSSINRALKEE